MLQRIHLVVSIGLAVCVAWMIARNRMLEAVAAEARMVSEEHAQHLLYGLRSKYEPEDDLVFRVGDRVEIRGFGPDIVEVVQRDGKLLMPNQVGWFRVAGRARSEVEAELKKTYLAHGDDVPLNLVVVEASQ